MRRVQVAGLGAVSPAGWGVSALIQAIRAGLPLATASLARPGWEQPLKARTVPPPSPRPAFMTHPRLRRSSAISRFGVGAALEALGKTTLGENESNPDLAIIVCVMSGCVGYSRRFYDEVCREPASASPLLFPETVFNAPASHLATLLGATGLNYTLVGDPGTFLQGLALGNDWVASGQVSACLVLGTEEVDWVTADSFRLFARELVLSEGAGAILLRPQQSTSAVRLGAVTNPCLFTASRDRTRAALDMREQLPAGDSRALLCDSTQGLKRYDTSERMAWADWPGRRLAPKLILGEGLVAAAAWQCVAAIDALEQGDYSAASVSVVGCNQQAIGALFLQSE